MHFLAYKTAGREGLAVQDGSQFRGLFVDDKDFPGTLPTLVAQGTDALSAAATRLRGGQAVDPEAVEVLPPFPAPGKIVCLGLNYADHAAEADFEIPNYPTIFARFASSLVGHGAPIIRPRVSTRLDYEGEMVAVIGKGGRHIAVEDALAHVAGYSIFNDASIRDYQAKTPQWTVGKNFDGTGPFGPYFVTADALPPGAKGLKLETRLNGQVMQSASTDSMIFDVATTVSLLSEVLTFEPGDVIVTGTPAGVGFARKPRVWMQPGDVCEVSIEGIGVLRNPIADEAA
jgi:2-keto-4-pentenoate hydratase/2-oxohepta-3-ene-1,7-dioic acid hydratase in catechol pathway